MSSYVKQLVNLQEMSTIFIVMNRSVPEAIAMISFFLPRLFYLKENYNPDFHLLSPLNFYPKNQGKSSFLRL